MIRIGLRQFLNKCLERTFSYALTPDFRPVLSPSDRKASANFSLVIPICDSPQVVARCLNSLRAYGGEAEIILVDDGSQQISTIELCQNAARENNWKLIRNDVGVGHSEATRIGVACATRPLLCLLNSDTIFPPCTWRAILDVFAGDPRTAVVGPSTCHCHTKQLLDGIIDLRFVWTDGQVYQFAERYTAFWRTLRRFTPRALVAPNIKHAGGFAFFIRRNVWDEMGGFEPRLKDYFNETELCHRIGRKGYRIVWTKEAYIHHLAEQSYGMKPDESVIQRKRAAEKIFHELMGRN